MPDHAVSPPSSDEEREVDAILSRFGEDLATLHALMDAQLSTLHARAQSLIGLASVVITVTGFSGRIIADTNDYAQWLIIIGITLVGLSAAVTMLYVLPIRWLTSYIDLPAREWLLTALERRRTKNRALIVALWLISVGMAFYIASIAVMLSFPEATELSRVR